MKKDTLQKIGAVVGPVLAAMPGLFLILYYIIGPAEGYMTSDCTDSMRWAQASFESGRLVSDRFYYAALLPFGGNLFFWPFIALFGYTMKAQICGLVLHAVLFAAALYYLARGIKLGRTASAGMVSVVMLILSSSPKLREILWEHIFYYNLGILFFCFGFGLALRLIRDDGPVTDLKKASWKDWLRLAVLLLFCLIAATDGLQTLVCFTMPLLGGLLIDYFLNEKNTLARSGKTAVGVLMVLIGLFSGVGFLLIETVSGGVSAGYANAYSTYSNMGDWTNNFLGTFYNWFTLFGISVKQGQYFVSVDSVIALIKIFGALMLLFLPFVLCAKMNRFKNPLIRVVLMGHLCVSAFIIFATTFGSLGHANWRLTPMMGTSAICCYLAAAEWIRENGKLRLSALLLAAMIVLAGITGLDIARMPADYGRNNSWHMAARVLKEKNLTYGYANFWWAELVTLISGNEVQVINIEGDKAEPSQNNYQIPFGCYEDRELPEDCPGYFLMLTERERTKMDAWLKKQSKDGKISDYFTITSEPYYAGGYSGKELYVYVFPENIF